MAWEAERPVSDMTITRQMLDTTYVCWFRNKRNTEKAKQEILKRFSEETDDIHHWTEQDIYEQSRKIIACWDNA